MVKVQVKVIKKKKIEEKLVLIALEKKKTAFPIWIKFVKQFFEMTEIFNKNLFLLTINLASNDNLLTKIDCNFKII